MSESLRPYPTFYEDPKTAALLDSWTAADSVVDRGYLQTHAGRFAYTIDLLQRLGPIGRLLDVGGTPATAEIIGSALELESYDLTPAIDLEIDHWGAQVGGGYDVALCAEVIEHMNADPALLLQQANQCLKLGGYLVVTTVNIGSVLGIQRLLTGEGPYAMGSVFGKRGDRHHREYAPHELERLVAAQGFEVAWETIDLYEPLTVRHLADNWFSSAIPDADRSLHGDTIVVVARKVVEQASPRRLAPVYHHSVADAGHDILPDDVGARIRGSIDALVETAAAPAPTPPEHVATFECPSCHSAVEEWMPGPNGRPNAGCPNCYALERHRLLTVVLEGLDPYIATARFVLEYAPQPQIRSTLQRSAGKGYVGVDLLDDRWIDSFADACDMPFPDDSFDLIVCFHILEHIPDDASAMGELARILKPGGLAIIQVPLQSGPTEEDPDASPEERTRRFGQDDHVRLYGDDFVDRLTTGGLDVSLKLGRDLVPDPGTRQRFGILDDDRIWFARKAAR